MPPRIKGLLVLAGLAGVWALRNNPVAMKAWRSSQFVFMGANNFTQHAFEKKKAKFTPGALDVDLKGMDYMVTGANSGLGYHTTLSLAQRGASVHMVCRSEDKGITARDEISSKTGNDNLELHVCDMSSMAQIKKLASDYLATSRPLHGLINNAGCIVPTLTKTPESIETNFATNSLGPYLLTKLLTPKMIESPGGRVVFVSSGGMYSEGLELINPEMDQDSKFDGVTQYARNKRQQVVLCEKLTEIHRDRDIKFFSMHPGWCDTASLAEAMPGFHKAFKDKMRTIEEGADTVVWLTIADEAGTFSGGQFFLDREPASKHLFWAGTQSSPSDADALIQMYEDYCQKLDVSS